MRAVDRLLTRGQRDALAPLRAEREAWLGRASVRPLVEAVRPLAGIRTEVFSGWGDAVGIGAAGELDEEQQLLLNNALRAFIPWRKGPFTIFGTELDAEWRSCRKWDRLVPELPALAGKVVADIGCNNGYYMFRMAAQEPELVVGFDPVPCYRLCFDLLHGFVPQLPLEYELLGVEELALFPGVFDVVFLMGVLYHHADPVGMLRGVRAALKPGGELLLETQGIPGGGSLALLPEARYAAVPGTWFVPTQECLLNLVRRSGFREVRIFDSHPMSGEEQRRTEWMPHQSYADFLDPGDPEKTIEGYPAPHRFYLKAVRPQ